MITMAMVDFLLSVLMASLMSAFVILLLKKLGAVEWLQANGIKAKSDKVNDIFSRLANCYFCLSFWTGVLIAIVAAIMMADWHLLLMPIFSAPLTRFIL